MDQPPPLTPQEIAARQTVQYANVGQPQTVKIFELLITWIYPILTLVLLNRPKTKEWFAAQPE